MLTKGKSPGMSFYVRGSVDEDSLLVSTEGFTGRIELQIPVSALPWRDLRLIEKWGRRREPYGCCTAPDPMAAMKVTARAEVEMRTGIEGRR
jgi:hypothetical protein